MYAIRSYYETATGYVRGTWDDTSTPTPGGQYPWFYVKGLETTAGWTKYYDNVSQAPYLYNQSTGVFLTYEDEQSLTTRCNFINDNQYGGLIIWEISGDDLSNGAPLTNIAYNELLINSGNVNSRALKSPFSYYIIVDLVKHSFYQVNNLYFKFEPKR